MDDRYKSKNMEINKQTKYGLRKFRKKIVAVALGSILVLSLVSTGFIHNIGIYDVYAENGVCPMPYTVGETPEVPAFRTYVERNVYAYNEEPTVVGRTSLVETQDIGDGKKHVTVTFLQGNDPST